MNSTVRKTLFDLNVNVNKEFIELGLMHKERLKQFDTSYPMEYFEMGD